MTDHYSTFMKLTERADQLRISPEKLKSRIIAGSHPAPVDGSFYGPAMKAFDEARAAASIREFGASLARKKASASRAAPAYASIEPDYKSLKKEAAIDVRLFLKTRSLPNKPNLANIRNLPGDVPADIRKAFHLPNGAGWFDAWAALTRDKSEAAGRKMIELDEAATNQARAQTEDVERTRREEKYRTEKRAGLRAQREAEAFEGKASR